MGEAAPKTSQEVLTYQGGTTGRIGNFAGIARGGDDMAVTITGSRAYFLRSQKGWK